jgi:hypothetical protein
MCSLTRECAAMTESRVRGGDFAGSAMSTLNLMVNWVSHQSQRIQFQREVSRNESNP